MKINELKKVGEREVEKLVHIPAVYDESGNMIAEAHDEIQLIHEDVFESVTRDMTHDEELAALADTDESEREQFYLEMNRPLDNTKKMELFIQSLPVDDKPEDRPGYMWKPIFKADGTGFGWEEIADPYYIPAADGSYINPFLYVNGMEIKRGKWYTDGDNIWEALKNGVPDGFDDGEFFDII